MKLLLFTFITYGITNILIFGSIFNWWRNLIGANANKPKNLGKLFSCFMCLSFWVGILVSLFIFSPSNSYLSIDNHYLTLFSDGVLASGIVWVLHTYQESLEQ